jgi:hypothetical protein
MRQASESDVLLLCCAVRPAPAHLHLPDARLNLPLRLPPPLPCAQGAVSQITPVSLSIFKLPAGRPYPPALFVHMAERDPGKAETVTAALALLM